MYVDKQGVAEATRGIRDLSTSPPLYMPRLVLLLIANAVNWGFALYGYGIVVGFSLDRLLIRYSYRKNT